MRINNLTPVIITFLYLVIMFLIDYYKNIKVKVVNKKIISLDEIPVTLGYYLYNNSNVKSLFNLTFLDLIEREYLKLVEIDDKTYVKRTKQSKKDLFSFELTVLNYIEQMIKNQESNLEDLDFNIKLDVKFNLVLNKYCQEVKKEANKLYGTVDFYSDYIFSFIFGILYFMIIGKCINHKFNIPVLFIMKIGRAHV